MFMKQEVAQRGFLVTAIVGLIVAGLRLSNELTTGGICPPLGPVPFCAIVLASYRPIVVYAAKFPHALKILVLVGGLPCRVESTCWFSSGTSVPEFLSE